MDRETKGGVQRVFFRCQRSGNCCRVGTGRVWLEEGELEAMASELEFSEQAFADRFAVRVGERISLREQSDGRCVLLEGSCHCTVYKARPQQCRDFPEWPQLHADAQAWQRAASYCPGIQQLPGPATLAQTRKALLGAMPDPKPDADGKAPCLRAEGQRLVSSIETDAFLAAFPHTLPQRESACPALEGEACTADSARPAACRNLSPEALAEATLEIQRAAEVVGYPWSRSDWNLIRADRMAAWDQSGRSLSPFDV